MKCLHFRYDVIILNSARQFKQNPLLGLWNVYRILMKISLSAFSALNSFSKQWRNYFFISTIARR